MQKCGNSRVCLASSPQITDRSYGIQSRLARSSRLGLKDNATQVSVSVLGNPVQSELAKQLLTCGGGVGRGRGVGVGRGGTVAVVVAVAVGVAVGVCVAVAVAVGVNVAVASPSE